MIADASQKKRIPPSGGSKAALRDPALEVDLRSKQLTDAGFSELRESLEQAVRYDGSQGKVVLLEELCLKANRLTVASLQCLTPIIDIVAQDLRDLDLSDNMISINDPGDVILWEAFLQSLSKCCVLRRLDLSGNELGTKAFEVFARVYAREETIELGCRDRHDHMGETPLRDCTSALEHVNLTHIIASASEAEEIDNDEDQKRKSKTRKEKIPRHGARISLIHFGRH